MKIVTILGARPQFIKAGSVSRELLKYKEIEEIIVHTGQHYDLNMSDVFFEEMQIPAPKYFLDVNNKSHASMTGEMLTKIEEVVLKENPDWVMVYGDTNSTLAGALVASKLNIKLAHVEAGLRSFNTKMPEEINRILTDRVSNLLFCTDSVAVKNLENEGFKNFECDIVLNGDVMKDGAIFYKNFAKQPKSIDKIDEFVLCTVHRAENTDNSERLKNIVDALNEISLEKKIVLPIHPRTQKVLEEMNFKLDPNLLLIKPVGYLEMVWLIDNSSLVMTDSGGLQKEAYFFKKPCITLRDETEWVELVDENYNVLVGADYETIINTYRSHEFCDTFNKELYGDGNACKYVAKELLENC